LQFFSIEPSSDDHMHQVSSNVAASYKAYQLPFGAVSVVPAAAAVAVPAACDMYCVSAAICVAACGQPFALCCLRTVLLQSQQLAAALQGPLLLSKGREDVITDGKQLLLVQADGSPRRCGGQGDVLTGM
jgi:hypothetical protein